MATVAQPQFTFIDDDTHVGFIEFFHLMPPKPAATLRIFDRNEFYTLHGIDAIFTAKEWFRTPAVIQYLASGPNTLESVILNKMNFESFVRKVLLVKQLRVEIYKNKKKFENEWILVYKASPGNLHQLEDIVFGDSVVIDSNVVMAINLAFVDGQKVVGVAFSDSSSHKLGVCQFNDNDQLSNIESLIVQLGPKECLAVSSDISYEATILRKILKRSNILITEMKKADFNSKDIIQDLNRILKLSPTRSSSSLPEIDLHHSMEALAAVINYLELLSDERNFKTYHLSTFDLNQYMKLDPAAARALNLEACPGEEKSTSLQGLLNKCRTSQGQRLIVQWIKQPLIDLKRIIERQDIVEIFVDNVPLRHTLQDKTVKCLPDFFRLTKKLQKGKGSLQDCVCIYQGIQVLPSLIQELSGYQGNHTPLLKELFITPLKELEQDFVKYQEMIETTIDMDMIQHHEFLIKPSFDEGLQRLRDNMDKIEEKINSIFRKTASELSLDMGKTLKLETNNQLGYYLRVTKKMEKCLRGQRRFIILETRNEGVRFTLSPLRSLSEDYSQLREQYNENQQKFTEEVLQIAVGYSDPLITFNDIIAQLDALLSLAQVATSSPIPYVRPAMTSCGEGDIELIGARHPCLEIQDDINFIANDVSLIRGKDEFQIITGPNMGGKSTYIRMIGVIVLMAQIGSFVPCTTARVSIIDCILARVGAGDSQIRGVSTFMTEMLETATILKRATKSSLIIIDELGRGTSTYDGFGLAWAISEHIATRIGCFCLFATHFHELTSLADSVETVSNRHVTALTSDNTLTFLYRVKRGVCDRSFGIYVAELAHFPLDVVEFARQKAAELEISYNIGSNDDSMDEPAAKKRRIAMKEGEQLIDEYLGAVHLLPLNELTEDELKAELLKLRQNVISKSNPYIEAILASNMTSS